MTFGFQKVKCSEGRTCAFGLNRFGEIVFETPVDKLNSDVLQGFLSENIPSKAIPEAAFFTYKDSIEFKFDAQLARLIVSNRYSGEKLYIIRSSNFDLSKISSLLHGKEKENFLKYGKKVNREMTAYLSKFVSFQLKSDSTFLMCLEYHNIEDSTVQRITDKYAFVEYSIDGKLKSIRLANIPSDIVFYNATFIWHKDFIYIPFWKLNDMRSNEPQNWDSVQYIARLSLRDNEYHIDSLLPVLMPWYYAKKMSYDDLSISYSSYPYITSYLGNEITNLNDGKTINIIPNKEFRKNVDLELDGTSKIQFHCYGVTFDKNVNEVIAMYKYGPNLYLNRYNPELNLIEGNKRVHYNFVQNAEFIWTNMYPEINLLTVLNRMGGKDFYEYSLPLNLFY